MYAKHSPTATSIETQNDIRLSPTSAQALPQLFTANRSPKRPGPALRVTLNSELPRHPHHPQYSQPLQRNQTAARLQDLPHDLPPATMNGYFPHTLRPAATRVVSRLLSQCGAALDRLGRWTCWRLGVGVYMYMCAAALWRVLLGLQFFVRVSILRLLAGSWGLWHLVCISYSDLWLGLHTSCPCLQYSTATTTERDPVPRIHRRTSILYPIHHGRHPI